MTVRKIEHSIVTFTGHRFWPLDPRSDEVDIADIAHALSNVTRFTGHTREFYSVAQHSVYVSELVPPEFALWGLLHDASEAYLADIASPVKRQWPVYKAYEHHLMLVIAEHFKLPWPEPPEVKTVDGRVLMTEKRDLMPSAGEGGYPGLLPYDMTIIPVPPKTARSLFVARFLELTNPKEPVEFQACYDPRFSGDCDSELGCGMNDYALSVVNYAEKLANTP